MDEFLTLDEAVELLGYGSKDGLSMFLGRHRVPRYVRRTDLLLAKAAAPGQGTRSDLCTNHKIHHVWSREHSQTEDGEPMVWCEREDCEVGAVLRDDGSVSYLHRYQ